MRFSKFIDDYLSIFTAPIILILYAIFYVKHKDIGGWEDLVAFLWVAFAAFGIVLSGIFLAVNHFWLKWKLNWWKNILLSVGLLLAGCFLFSAIVRISELYF